MLNKELSWAKLLIVMIMVVIVSSLAPRAQAATGTQVFEIGISTPADTPVLLALGAGTLTQLEISSGSAGDYFVVYDSSQPTLSLLAMDGIPAQNIKRIATVLIAATNTTTGLPPPAEGRPFSNGVVFRASAGNRRALIVISQ